MKNLPGKTPAVASPGLRKAPAATSTLPRQRPLRILLAEDNAMNQRVAVANLESWGHRVTVANDGMAAVEAVARVPFDLILMDSQMPRMDGFEATAAIRQRERENGAHVPIVAMTANVMKGFREECLAAGMDGFVAKPIRLEELIAAMAVVVPDLLLEEFKHPADAGAAPIAGIGGDQPFDSAALLASVGGDRELLREIVKLCCEVDGPRVCGELAVAVGQGDLSGVERAAHAIKGLVGAFHAPVASHLARDLEETARQGSGDAVVEPTAELGREFQRLVVALQGFVSESDETVVASRSPSDPILSSNPKPPLT